VVKSLEVQNDTFTASDLNKEALKHVKVFSVGSMGQLPGLKAQALAELFAECRAYGVRTVLDLTGDMKGSEIEWLAPIFPHTDFFVPNYYEASRLTESGGMEDIADRLLSFGIGNVVVKNGNRGCHIQSRSEKHLVPAFKVDVMDTTGAGDAFNAGFIAGVLKGLSLYECGVWGNASGAMCVKRIGASPGFRHINELMDFIEYTDLQVKKGVI